MCMCACRFALQLTSPVSAVKPRKRVPGIEDLTHPLLGDQPTLKLLPDQSKVRKGWLVSGGAVKCGGEAS